MGGEDEKSDAKRICRHWRKNAVKVSTGAHAPRLRRVCDRRRHHKKSNSTGDAENEEEGDDDEEDDDDDDDDSMSSSVLRYRWPLRVLEVAASFSMEISSAFNAPSAFEYPPCDSRKFLACACEVNAPLDLRSKSSACDSFNSFD